jgi:hypothetical protein
MQAGGGGGLSWDTCKAWVAQLVTYNLMKLWWDLIALN